MNNVTMTIENNLKTFANSLHWMSAEAKDLYQYFWGTSANTLVGGLATDGTAATTQAGGALTKAQFTNGITLCTALNNFFGNAAVSQGGYLAIADTLINGNTPAGAALSQDVENIGARIKTLAAALIQLRKDADNLSDVYDSSYLSAIIGGLPASMIVYGTSLPQAKLVSGMVLVEQFEKMLLNEAVTTGDYQSTITNLVYGA